MKGITVLIADDHPLIRDGLRSRLCSSDAVTMISEASNGVQAIALAEQIQPDIVLMDINMPVMNGIDCAEIFQKRFPETKLLVLSMHDDRAYILNVLRLGAKGYILKTAPSEEMLTAIHEVYNGGFYYSPSIAEIILQRSSEQNDSLTSREQTILSLLAAGMSNKEMARELNISTRTVETHRCNIKNKLGIKTTSNLIRYAIDARLVYRGQGEI